MTMAEYIRIASNPQTDFCSLYDIATKVYDERFGRDVTRLFEALTKSARTSCVTLAFLYYYHSDFIITNSDDKHVYEYRY